MSVKVYLEKVSKGGYSVSEKITEEYREPHPWSLSWESNWAPFNRAIDVVAEIKGIGRGLFLAKIFEAIAELRKRMPNTALAVAHAKQAVEFCVQLGNDRDKCVSVVAAATGLSRSFLTGGGGTARGGGGGAPA